MRYFITFACYGTRLHGDESGSVERMKQAPYLLDGNGRAAVLQAVRKVCLYRGWNRLAAHVRTSQVHLVVESEVRPETILNTVKSYASRGLNRLGGERSDRRRWARHGSTRWLWNDQNVRDAIRYVVEEQGDPMTVFLADTL